VQVHHAGQRRGEAHAVLDAAVAVQPHQRVALRHIVQKAEPPTIWKKKQSTMKPDHVVTRVHQG